MPAQNALQDPPRLWQWLKANEARLRPAPRCDEGELASVRSDVEDCPQIVRERGALVLDGSGDAVAECTTVAGNRK